ncbi:MAG: ATP-binding cassette domain-containing protein [Lentisphaerota bacterium]
MIAEPVLNALLHLFALAAARLDGEGRKAARVKVLAYLNNHVGLTDAEAYIGLYDGLIEVHEEADDDAILESAAQMAGRLKPLLHGFEKYAALIRFLELAAISSHADVPNRIVRLLGENLGVVPGESSEILSFIVDPEAAARSGADCRILGSEKDGGFQGRLAALRLQGEELFLVSPVSDDAIRLEVHPLEKGCCYPLRPGHVLRDRWGNELYFANIADSFSEAAPAGSRIVFQGTRLDFLFPHSNNGLHDFSFVEHGGRMVGIMGGSGAGKSTLMGILNGTIRPDSGDLLLNGRHVHSEPEAVEGVIGFVPQDDLLFEDLTVFENLYFAARLCMAHLPPEDLTRRVRALLTDLGQAEAADLRVGSPLQKTISGGQRKRLNIALELIREPTVLFVDEPTSGLSSADSEIVMSLLKEQASRGKLVFVVIHQPSSKIFRMFDALWVLDQGGWPIFNGTPLEAVTYFRSRGALPGAGESICPHCGGVNPEQLFEIIESKTLDESGQFTRERRISPDKWHTLYRHYMAEKENARSDVSSSGAPPPPLEKKLNRPGLLGQLKIFFERDVRARFSNRQYILINLLEPPLLGLLIGLVSRGAIGGEYSFYDNHNVHVFFFMSVIVSLFLGLSVSAEEICRDGRILRRERFLHLSWWSYINSKTIYLALVAALQMALYVIPAVWMVEAPGMWLKSWAVLFLCALCSSLLGLNISASFRSAITIYILIPLVLVPQMLLCGVVIKYDDLIAPQSIRREVPRYANLLPPRWGYEALIVEQYGGNDYMRHILEPDAVQRMAEYDLDYYLPELQSRVQSVALLRTRKEDGEVTRQLRILQNEEARLEQRTGLSPGLSAGDFQPDAFDAGVSRRMEAWLADCRKLIFERRRAAAAEKREIETGLEKTLGRQGLEAFKKKHTNRSIQEQVLNLKDMEPVGSVRDGLFQKTLPVYQTPESRWGEAHFLARHKRVGAFLVPTYLFNLMAIAGLTVLLYLALGFKALPRLLRFRG